MWRKEKIKLALLIDTQELIDELWLSDQIRKLIDNTLDVLPEAELDEILESRQFID